MIAVCIPIYNYVVTDLIVALQAQAKHLGSQIEIIAIDDGSKEEFKAQNRELCKAINYTELPDNIGRAAIRNLFLEHSQQEWLLFLDCDSLIESDFFLKTYVDAITNYSTQVICGGRRYPSLAPEKAKSLRYRYGIKRESKTARERAKNANHSFMTNNFVLRRSVLEQIKFNQKIRKYGHEDTLFGIDLKKAGISITHIENPILNGHLETNQEYLIQTQQAIENLIMLLDQDNYKKELIAQVTLLNTYYNKPVTKFLARICYGIFRKLLVRKIEAGTISVAMFNMYKLGYLDHKISNGNYGK